MERPQITDTKTVKSYFCDNPKRGRTTTLIDKRTNTKLIVCLGVGTRKDLWKSFQLNKSNIN